MGGGGEGSLGAMARTLPHPTSLGLSAHDRVGHYIKGP